MSIAELRSLIAEAVRDILEEKKKSRKHARRKKDVGGRPKSNPDTEMSQFSDDFGGSKKVADAVGVTRGQINKLERGDELPSLQLAADLAKVSSGRIGAEYWLKQAQKAK